MGGGVEIKWEWGSGGDENLASFHNVEGSLLNATIGVNIFFKKNAIFDSPTNLLQLDTKE